MPQSASHMFALVMAIDRYPDWFGWCVDARRLEEGEAYVVDELDVSLGPFTARFATRNTYERPVRIDLVAVSGPVTELQGRWQFEPIGNGGCRVALTLEVNAGRSLLAAAAEIGFARLADRLVDDFCAVARRQAIQAADGNADASEEGADD